MEQRDLCRPLFLGGLLIPGRLILAPMAGITDDVMRLICTRYGAALTYTEMVSAKGLLMSEKSRELLQTRPGEGAVAAQLFGHDPEDLAEAAHRIETEYADIRLIDINMGCPAHKITRSKEGSALLTDLPLAQRIMETVKKAVRLPVSVKMRLGYEKNGDVSQELACMAKDCGICAVTVHGRTKEQGYAGQADWDAIARVKHTVGNGLVVIGNGDVKSAREASLRMEQTGCDAVMIGRAAIGNPWIFSGTIPDCDERLGVILEHVKLEVEKLGEEHGIAFMRKILAAYVHGIPGATKARARFFQANDLNTVTMALKELYHGIEEGEMQ